jgi:hypothetical protein
MILTNIEINPYWVAYIAAVIAGLSVIIPNLEKMFKFGIDVYDSIVKRTKRIKTAQELEEVNRKLTNKQYGKLLQNPLFSDINIIIHNSLKSTYFGSLRGNTQKVFILQMSIILKIHEADLLSAIEGIAKNKFIDKQKVITKVLETVQSSRKNAEEYIEACNVPIEAIGIFNRLYDLHYDWYFWEIESWLRNAESYYEELNDFLKLSKAFVNAIASSAKLNIDKYNGELKPYLTEKVMQEIDFREFTYLKH